MSERRELTVLVFKSKNKSKVSVINVWFHNKILQIHLQKCDPYVNLSWIPKLLMRRALLEKFRPTMARRLKKKSFKTNL